ncbi:MAG TPA: LegC family aminotransferase [Gemmatimonadaceae bacterium]|nr:LegC family aminotransferase [Gemmatimonadaceae bacterium]
MEQVDVGAADTVALPDRAATAPGAPAAPGFVPLCVPRIQGNEWRYVKECLDTNWVSSVGAYVDRFERAVAERVGVAHAVATVNGTAALHVALHLAGVRPGDEVLVSSLTFIAPANAIRYVGAHPVFIDAEPDFWQMDVERVLHFLGARCAWRDGTLFNRGTGRPVRALLPVHVLGHPVQMDAILDAAGRYGLAVIEDATESLGAEWRGRPVGQLGDVACFSFNGNKLITTGGGGMLVTNNAEHARRARYLTTQAKDDPIEYVHEEVGYNYRLTNVLAAIGVAQMEQLDAYIAAKRRIARRYAAALGDVPGLTIMHEAPWARSVFWMYTILVDAARFGMDSRTLLRTLAAHGIQTRPLWQPLHLSRAHQNGEALRAPCPVAERLNRDALSLPCSVGLTDDEQDRVITAVLAAGST